MFKSLQRKQTTLAISSGFAILLIGISFFNFSNCSLVFVALVNSVNVKPGLTAFTKILFLAHSTARVFVNPIIHSGEQTWAPSGMVFYNSDKISNLEGKFLVGALRGQHLMVLDIDKNGSLISAEKMFEGDFGRIRTAQTDSDGVLYLLTSNGNNDKIIRISEAPLEEVTKFTSNKSESNQTIIYVIIGIIIGGVIVSVVVIKRKK